jgi:hypothetical protein
MVRKHAPCSEWVSSVSVMYAHCVLVAGSVGRAIMFVKKFKLCGLYIVSGEEEWEVGWFMVSKWFAESRWVWRPDCVRQVLLFCSCFQKHTALMQYQDHGPVVFSNWSTMVLLACSDHSGTLCGLNWVSVPVIVVSLSYFTIWAERWLVS